MTTVTVPQGLQEAVPAVRDAIQRAAGCAGTLAPGVAAMRVLDQITDAGIAEVATVKPSTDPAGAEIDAWISLIAHAATRALELGAAKGELARTTSDLLTVVRYIAADAGDH